VAVGFRGDCGNARACRRDGVEGKTCQSARSDEQRITANPQEVPVTSSVISPEGKYIAYFRSYGGLHTTHRQRRDTPLTDFDGLSATLPRASSSGTPSGQRAEWALTDQVTSGRANTVS